MKIKAAIKKIMVPRLSEFGFVYKEVGKQHWCFINSDDTIHIIIWAHTGCINTIRVTFSVRGHADFDIEMDNFFDSFFPHRPSAFVTQEEFDAFLLAATEDIIHILLPYLNAMLINCINPSESEWQEYGISLSHDTLLRAERFANKYIRGTTSYKESMHNAILSWQSTVVNRKVDFYNHIDDILDLTAYLGNKIAQAAAINPPLWAWTDRCGQLCYIPMGTDFDPLPRVIDAWNLGAEVKNYSLLYFPLC